MALRMGVQLGVFRMICDRQEEGTTTEQMAAQSGASVIVVGGFTYLSSYNAGCNMELRLYDLKA